MTRLTPRPARRVAATILSVLALSCGLALGAASSSSQDALDWARTALQRSGPLQIVAADPATGLITVRVDPAGEISQASPAPAARVLLSGPGYRIATAGPQTGPVAGTAQGGSSSALQTGAGASLTSIPVERRHEPIVCQGARLLHIDSRNLEFDGDAVTAESGCEVHITNSRIVARGVGVLARGASVHIDNSSIEGGEGSVEASGGAQVYARSSTFGGLIRRLDTAAFHDMGGNVGD